MEFRTPSQTIQQDVYRSRTEADSPHLLLIDLSAKVKDLGYDLLADELWGAIGVFDAVQNSAEGDGVFTAPEADEETGLFLDDFYNDVLEKILSADKKKEEK